MESFLPKPPPLPSPSSKPPLPSPSSKPPLPSPSSKPPSIPTQKPPSPSPPPKPPSLSPPPKPSSPPFVNDSNICLHYCILSEDSYIYCDEEPNFTTIKNGYIWNCGIEEYDIICTRCPMITLSPSQPPYPLPLSLLSSPPNTPIPFIDPSTPLNQLAASSQNATAFNVIIIINSILLCVCLFVCLYLYGWKNIKKKYFTRRMQSTRNVAREISGISLEAYIHPL